MDNDNEPRLIAMVEEGVMSLGLEDSKETRESPQDDSSGIACSKFLGERKGRVGFDRERTWP